MKGQDGQWRGVTVELWQQIAGNLGLETRLVERPFDQILGEIAAGRLDTAVGPFAATMERQRLVDFTHDYTVYQVGVAVLRKNEGARGVKILHALTTPTSLMIYVSLAFLMLAAGAALWLIERRHNPMFGGRPAHGLGSGYWWAGVTTFGVGYGDKVPMTFWGRCIALIWMLISVMLLASLTAHVAAQLAVAEFGRIQGPANLRNTIVGGVSASAATEWLRDQQIPHRLYATPRAALEALRNGQVDSVVYGKATLQYYADREAGKLFDVLPLVLDTQKYAFPLRNGSPLRDPINQQLRLVLTESRWNDIYDRYLGTGASAPPEGN
jgi:polar amino acid transport system substrate-binding protein